MDSIVLVERILCLEYLNLYNTLSEVTAILNKKIQLSKKYKNEFASRLGRLTKDKTYARSMYQKYIHNTNIKNKQNADEYNTYSKNHDLVANIYKILNRHPFHPFHSKESIIHIDSYEIWLQTCKDNIVSKIFYYNDSIIFNKNLLTKLPELKIMLEKIKKELNL